MISGPAMPVATQHKLCYIKIINYREPLFEREESFTFSTPIGRPIDMKNKIFLTAFTIIIAVMALGFATVSPLPSSQKIAPAVLRMVDSIGASAAHRSYCFNGARSEQGHLDRGWVCLSKPGG